MKAFRVHLGLLGLIFLGCSNPFASKDDPPIMGIWEARIRTVEPKVVAFLRNGRYLENNIKVGLYTIDDRISGGTTDWVIRIDYDDGESIKIIIATSANPVEITIGNSNNRGPAAGFYDQLHTGEGL